MVGASMKRMAPKFDLQWIAAAIVLLLALGPMAVAQSSKVLALEDAVEFALKNYPAVRVALERVSAAQEGVGLARTSYLPRTDLFWHTNRATDNNDSGPLLPQSSTAPITRPATRTPS